LTRTPEDTPARIPLITGYHDLAELELRKLEDIGPDSSETAYVTARGFAALAYALLALRETYQEEATDLSNTLHDISGAASDTAAYTGLVVDMLAALTWWRRLAWRLRPGRPDSPPEEP
jgi:hypothetical protein